MMIIVFRFQINTKTMTHRMSDIIRINLLPQNYSCGHILKSLFLFQYNLKIVSNQNFSNVSEKHRYQTL